MKRVLVFSLICLVFTSCSQSPEAKIKKYCRQAQDTAAKNAGDADALARGMLSGLLTGICDKAQQACHDDPQGAECQNALQVLSAAGNQG